MISVLITAERLMNKINGMLVIFVLQNKAFLHAALVIR